MKHILQSQQFDRDFIEELFVTTTNFETAPHDTLRGKIMASLFYEPSTRTRLSFEAAMHRLGGSVIGTENAAEFSSAIKGETLEDSIRVISGYCDVIVLRHPEAGAALRAAEVSSVPVINAGDGAGQHPTQALLDLYTIYRERGAVDGTHIALAGDLKYGRTVRSLSYLLGKFNNIHITLVSPRALQMEQDIKDYLKTQNVSYTETETLEDVIPEVDVLYQTRIQRERFSDPEEYERYKGVYRVTRAMAEDMQKDAIIMHPLPRVNEILVEVDASPKARYFKQTYYGLLVRMALLQHVLGA